MCHASVRIALAACLACFGPTVAAQESPTPSCRDCHNGTADTAQPGPPHETIARSIHATLDCTDCHQAISFDDLEADSLRPHGAVVPPSDCGECHEEEAEVYQKHGRLEVGHDPDLPRCSSCHGTHDILATSDRHSHTHPINLPDTCRACHTDVDLVKKHAMLEDKPITLYESSVHGQATRKGLYVAANCNDCHAVPDEQGRRTAHRILSSADPESTIYHFNIPDTCGRCHQYVTRDYWEGIHGQYVKRGAVEAPVCTHCHGEHGIISPSDPRSPVSAARVAERTCEPCHESALLNEKYGLAGGRLASYVDSYHGLKSQAGDATVANCASCHGAHRILPSTDPTSSIHSSNLRETCGECHPGITAELAQTKIHQTAAGADSGWPEFFRKLYVVLIVVTIGGMLLHNGADWVRRVRQMKTMPFVHRLSPVETAQHWVLMLSFIVLVMSGFSLRFSEAAWVKLLFGWEGGFAVRGVIHRVAAVVMMFGGVWHVLYLLSLPGRAWLKDMMARRSDLTHIKQNVRFFLGLQTSEPRFKRFSYVEKVEYWALVWGTAIMAATGLALWFDNALVERWALPKVLLDVALVIHYYEAWLASLAILVWHVYATVFKPTVYPMNPSWLAGRMPREMYIEEHPEGPKLKSRTLVAHYEEEPATPPSDTETIDVTE